MILAAGLGGAFDAQVTDQHARELRGMSEVVGYGCPAVRRGDLWQGDRVLNHLSGHGSVLSATPLSGVLPGPEALRPAVTGGLPLSGERTVAASSFQP